MPLIRGVSYTYINDTHLVSVTSGSNNYALSYDALGRCVKRTLNNATTYYIYDGEKPIQEIGPAWASTIYGIGVDEPVIRFTSVNVHHFYQDHEGSMTHVLNNNNTLVERYRYDAFGAPTIMDGNWNVRTVSAIGNRFMFTGREWAAGQWATVNPPLGFDQYKARAYNPTLGRFMSEDPKDFDGGDYNLFRYCHNDPEDHTDPMGTDGNNLPVTDWRLHHIDQELAARELAGLDTTGGRAAESAAEGAIMAQAQLQEKNSSVTQAQSLGPGATITRSVVDSGVEYPEGFYSRPWVYFKYVLQDDGKPAPAGIHVSENVSLVNTEGMPRYFIVTAPYDLARRNLV